MSAIVEMTICMNNAVLPCESFLVQVRARGCLGSVPGNQGLNESILPYLLYQLSASHKLEEQSSILPHFCTEVDLTSFCAQAWHRVECSSLSILTRRVHSPVCIVCRIAAHARPLCLTRPPWREKGSSLSILP